MRKQVVPRAGPLRHDILQVTQLLLPFKRAGYHLVGGAWWFCIVYVQIALREGSNKNSIHPLSIAACPLAGLEK